MIRYNPDIPRCATAVLVCTLSLASQVRFGYLTKHQYNPTLPSISPGRHYMVDYDRDGGIDIVTGGSSICNDGSANWKLLPVGIFPRVGNPVSFFFGPAALGDVDGDGDQDAVGPVMYLPLYGVPYSFMLFDNDGTGTFTPLPGRFPLDPTARGGWTELGDMDRDGDLDVVVADSTGTKLYLNDGLASFYDVSATALPLDTGNNSVVVLVRDMNGDQALDIVLATDGSFGASRNRVYVNDGRGVFTDFNALPETVLSQDLTVGDVDADGDLDVVYCGSYRTTPQSLRLYLNDGRANFTNASANLPQDLALWTSVELADMDLDGDVDLVAGRIEQWVESVRYFANDGTGRFQDVPGIMPAGIDTPILDIAVADIDQDGDLDLLLSANWCSGRDCRSKVYTNLLRELYTPFPAKLAQPFAIDVYGRAGDVIFPALALGSASIPLSSTLTLRLDPLSMFLFPPFIVPGSGMGSVSFGIPNDPYLVALPWTIHTQALVVDSSGAGRHAMTNLMLDLITP